MHYAHCTTQQLQLQLRHAKYTTLQLELQLHYTTLHPAVVGEVTTATIATTPKTHNSNHLSVHQWICSAIHASQQLISPIVSYFWHFRHRLVRYYWYYVYIYIYVKTNFVYKMLTGNHITFILGLDPRCCDLLHVIWVNGVYDGCYSARISSEPCYYCNGE